MAVRTKRIVFISTLNIYLWGGSEELWYQASRKAIEQGFEVFVTWFGDRTKNQKQLTTLEAEGIKIIYLGPEVYKRDSFFTRIKRKLLSQKERPEIINRFSFLEELKPDKILVNASTAISLIHYPDLTTWMLETGLRFSVLIHHHFENGVLLDSSKKSLALILAKAQTCFIVALRNMKVLERQLSSKITNVKLVSNPINVKNPQVISWPESDILQIAVVARLDCSCKGQDILIQSLSDSSWTGIHFNINLYGKGPDEEYIQTLIKFYQLEERVFLKGFRNDLTSIWKENHILMLPSISEGTPISLVEAMSCGRSAIVTDVGDSARLINNDINGFVSDGCNVNSLNKVLRRAINKSEEWEYMGLKAFDDFKGFNLQDTAKQFLDLLIAD